MEGFGDTRKKKSFAYIAFTLSRTVHQKYRLLAALRGVQVKDLYREAMEKHLETVPEREALMKITEGEKGEEA